MTADLTYVQKHRQLILDTLDHIWANPESGYREWKTHAYMAQIFEKLGYEITPAGNIPGFTAQIDTGREGPTLGIFGEMDALLIPDHPKADPETGAVHACGHCAQCAALVGIAAALKEPGALDGLSGKIRLIVVPAEELIESEYRLQLRQQGIIKYMGGKPEFLYRGLLDGIDLSFMVHTGFSTNINKGSNGLLAKTLTFQGVSAHAGGAPHNGVNALYAANLALNAINALRETFRDNDHIRVHPIITAGGSSVNAIPHKVVLESYVRGANMDAIRQANEKVNRACAASAAAMGAKLHINDFPGYWPRNYSEDFIDVFANAAEQAGLNFFYDPNGWGSGCSDMGDICSVMPGLHPTVAGSQGTAHGIDYRIADPDIACVASAKWQYAAICLLLENQGEKAKQIVAGYTPAFASKQDYFAYVDALDMNRQTVSYADDGTVLLDYKN